MSITTKLIAWARGRVGQKVGAGECWDLVNSALVAAGAKGSEDFGTIGDDVDYIWGDEVALNAAQAGDIVQTRDHVVTTTVKTRIRFADGTEEDGDEDTKIEKRPHHSAIVASLLDKHGTLVTLEQNVEPKGMVVQNKRLNSRDVPTVTTKKAGKATDSRTDKVVAVTIFTDTTITVTGTVSVYRPVKR